MKKWVLISLCVGILLLSACSPGGSPASSGETSSPAGEPLTWETDLPHGRVALSGRISQAGGRVALDWPGTGITVRFRGTGASLYVDTAESSDIWYPYVRLVVDGGKAVRTMVKGAGWIELCAGLPEGEHTVSLHKSTESGAYPLNVMKLRLTGTSGEEPVLLEPPEAPDRRIEFIGDSITCGYGVLGLSTEYAFTTVQEDVFSTYAAYTAAHFGADARYIAVSGKGIVRDAGGGTDDNLPDFFRWTSMNDRVPWDYSQWIPDVVVINAGTNDQDHTAAADFEKGAAAFLSQVRAAYPEATIIWCYGMMNEKLHDNIRRAVDTFNQSPDHGADAVYLPLESIGKRIGETGAGTHPNERAGRDRSRYLIESIQAVTGWEGAE